MREPDHLVCIWRLDSEVLVAGQGKQKVAEETQTGKIGTPIGHTKLKATQIDKTRKTRAPKRVCVPHFCCGICMKPMIYPDLCLATIGFATFCVKPFDFLDFCRAPCP